VAVIGRRLSRSLARKRRQHGEKRDEDQNQPCYCRRRRGARGLQQEVANITNSAENKASAVKNEAKNEAAEIKNEGSNEAAAVKNSASNTTESKKK
jgi:hypothetical protein